jgi:diaminopimelate decarboxylase
MVLTHPVEVELSGRQYLQPKNGNSADISPNQQLLPLTAT